MGERKEPSFGEPLSDLPGSTAPTVSYRQSATHATDFLREPDSDAKWIIWLAVIIVGTTVGGLLTYFAVRWYETRQMEAALGQFARTLTGTTAQMQREMAAAQERARLESIAARQRAEQERAERLAAERQAIELQNARIAAANAEQDRRERAWQKFYVPSDHCKVPDNRASMQCVNEFARAKKEFERQWLERQR